MEGQLERALAAIEVAVTRAAALMLNSLIYNVGRVGPQVFFCKRGAHSALAQVACHSGMGRQG